MIFSCDVIRAFHKYENEGKQLPLRLSEDEKNILDSVTGETVCTVETFVNELRVKEHCDFESIYYEHVSLTDIFRCRQCGTVIFGGDDEERYDPNCRCPTCCNDSSVCRNEFWTAEEIDSDLEKKKTIDNLIAEQKEMNEAEKRREARGGLYDWERWKKEFSTKKHGFSITLINFGYGYAPRCTQNIYLDIHTWKKSDGIVKHSWQIPLSFYNIHVRWIYPYTKKCHPSVRKYHFWQKHSKEINICEK